MPLEQWVTILSIVGGVATAFIGGYFTYKAAIARRDAEAEDEEAKRESEERNENTKVATDLRNELRTELDRIRTRLVTCESERAQAIKERDEAEQKKLEAVANERRRWEAFIERKDEIIKAKNEEIEVLRGHLTNQINSNQRLFEQIHDLERKQEGK